MLTIKLLKTMFKRLFNFFKGFIPRKQEEKPNLKQVNAQGVLLNRRQRRQLQFGKRFINNNRKHTRGRKMYKPTHQIIKLKDEDGNYTGQIKQIYHYPKAI